MHPALLRKKMIKELNAMLPTLVSPCYYSASFPCKTVLKLLKVVTSPCFI